MNNFDVKSETCTKMTLKSIFRKYLIDVSPQSKYKCTLNSTTSHFSKCLETMNISKTSDKEVCCGLEKS